MKHNTESNADNTRIREDGIKVIPMYLPQFHTIPENDEWWGKGFTEWVNIRNARPLYEGHRQPRVPLGSDYYDLSDVETLRRQCRLAREYGIYGFAMYHYWFNGHLLLEKPMEMLLANPDIDINYCISWANHEWTDAWKCGDNPPRTLISLNFDDEADWDRHFDYMLPFFKDPRYMKENGKPLMIIYIPNLIGKLHKMLDRWTELARQNGFEGLTYICQSAASSFDRNWDRSRFSYSVEMNPQYINLLTGTQKEPQQISFRLVKWVRRIKKLLGIRRSIDFRGYSHKKVRRLDYDICWKSILDHKPVDDKMIPCAFTDWDNTPRHRLNGVAYDGVSPLKFRDYFRQLLRKSRTDYRTDMVFVFAWNEWAEGGYLEPDEENGYAFLEAIRDGLEDDRRENAGAGASAETDSFQPDSSLNILSTTSFTDIL